jgi:hypothetical protein
MIQPVLLLLQWPARLLLLLLLMPHYLLVVLLLHGLPHRHLRRGLPQWLLLLQRRPSAAYGPCCRASLSAE